MRARSVPSKSLGDFCELWLRFICFQRSWAAFGSAPCSPTCLRTQLRLESRTMQAFQLQHWMCGCVGEWVDVWRHGRMGGPLGGLIDGWVDGCMDGWTDGWTKMDGRVDDCVDRWMHGCMDGCTGPWIDRWVDVLMGGWVGGWMDAWMCGWLATVVPEWAWVGVGPNVAPLALVVVGGDGAGPAGDGGDGSGEVRRVWGGACVGGELGDA